VINGQIITTCLFGDMSTMAYDYSPKKKKRAVQDEWNFLVQTTKRIIYVMEGRLSSRNGPHILVQLVRKWINWSIKRLD
jgi:hypothetical protein